MTTLSPSVWLAFYAITVFLTFHAIVYGVVHLSDLYRPGGNRKQGVRAVFFILVAVACLGVTAYWSL